MAATGSVVRDERLHSPDRAAFEVLRAAVGARLTTAPPEALRCAVAAVGDWESVVTLADHHRLTALVARALNGLSDGAVPAVTLAALRGAAFAVAGEALAAIDALGRLTRALEREGIPSLAWKGPALAMVAWGDPAARSFADIDVVVRPGDRHRARAIARELGWRSPHAMSSAQEEAIFGGLAAWELEREGAPRLLELHWEFSAKRYAGRLGVAEVLARSDSIRLGGARVRVPADADTLVLLAQHATKHGWSTLEDVAVFAAVARRAPDAMAVALERATPIGGRRALLLGARLAECTFDLAMPNAVAAAARSDDALASLLGAVRRRWDDGVTAWRPPLSWDLAWTDGLSARARLIGRALLDPTPKEWAAVRLPDSAVGFYRLLRPVRLGLEALLGRRTP